ncbi:MAG: 5-(carboxyamino)imidazole ribonucleotide mutase [Calothrix sp. SM1_5_4]|nr:5-(carboxyamino)imidazole ribonucleotide mutase [Calothrix sp. SM1_5_4]
MEKGIQAVKAKVGIIMGSQSDLRVMKGAAEILREFKIPFEMKVVSAHRTPEEMQVYAKTAEDRGLKVIIAGAGGAAHLPGMVASLTTLPVIGVPVAVNKLDGLDSLLSIAQMPKGVPVASMAIDNSHNAGLMALRMLALNDAKLAKALHRHLREMKAKVKKSQSTLKKFLKNI